MYLYPVGPGNISQVSGTVLDINIISIHAKFDYETCVKNVFLVFVVSCAFGFKVCIKG
jgi:hypothetical protein